MFINLNLHKLNMAVKTITVKEEAYEALKAVKTSNESFSDTLLRITKRKPLSSFFGIISKKTAQDLEETIHQARKNRTSNHKNRIQHITKELSDQ